MPARIPACLTAMLMLLVLAAPGAAWKVFPLVSYSSSSGILLGGVVSHNMIPPFSPFALNCMAYYYTGGSLYAGPEVMVPLGSGLLRGQLEYHVDREKKVYGWGNEGDSEDYGTGDRETQELSVVYHAPPAGTLLLSGGLLVRHSTVYNTNFTPDIDGGVWGTYPELNLASAWTVGPALETRWTLPGPVSSYLEAGGNLQTGGVGTYGEADAALAAFVPLSGSTVAAARVKAARHFGTLDTPFPFLPGQGGNTGLRGYADSRFGGEWTFLANLELRQRLVTFRLDSETSMSLGVVLFGDAGQVADGLDETRWDRFHLDGGLGARITIPGGGTLRADFALSPEGLGIQMGLGQLF